MTWRVDCKVFEDFELPRGSTLLTPKFKDQLYRYNTFCLSIHQSVDIWDIPIF